MLRVAKPRSMASDNSVDRALPIRFTIAGDRRSSRNLSSKARTIGTGRSEIFVDPMNGAMCMSRRPWSFSTVAGSRLFASALST